MTFAVAEQPVATRECQRGTPDWPAGLDALRDPPGCLRVRGMSELLALPAVSIVGSRAASAYGTTMATRLAADLARLGWVIVSGLARGIDAAAHRGALDVNGRTVAVLPGGLDRVSPPGHRALAASIARRGALVSERPDDMPVVHRGEFIRRNRLIAALARATVVVEAAETSGALATARVAAQLGRAVLAVPGDVDREGSRGTLGLLRAGARPCADAADVLAALQPGPPSAANAQGPAVAGPERLLSALDERPRTVDALAQASGLDPAATSAALLELSWAGLARSEPGGRWRRGRS